MYGGHCKVNELKDFKLQDLQEMDLALCENGLLYWILYNPTADSLALYNYTFYPLISLTDIDFNEDLTCHSDKQYTINKVLRSETKWYIMNRMREYEHAVIGEEDISMVLNSSKWKWTWKRFQELEGSVTTNRLEEMVCEVRNENWLSEVTKDKVFTGRQIKEEIAKLLEAPYIIRKGRISVADIEYFRDHYIDSEYSLSDFKYYVLYFGRFNIVVKRVDINEEGDIIWDTKK